MTAMATNSLYYRNVIGSDQGVDEHLETAYGKDYSRSKVQWCLTVPAGWSQVAKQTMVDAAVESGLVDNHQEAATRVELLHEVMQTLIEHHRLQMQQL
jgi:hypothetical protein